MERSPQRLGLGGLALAGAYVATETVLNLERQRIAVLCPQFSKLLGEVWRNARRNVNIFFVFGFRRTPHFGVTFSVDEMPISVILLYRI